MTTAKKGDTVQVHYRGTLADGSEFDSSSGRDPLQFTLGTGMVIPGFDQAVEGLKVGDKSTTHIPSDQAYGVHHPEAVLTVPASQMPPGLNPEVGQQLQMQGQDGRPIPVRVTEVTAESVTLDANHPLAGKDLTFEIELVAIS